MKTVHRILVALGAATTLLASQVPQASADPNVYTTPGGHQVNDRIWRTTCEKYSSTVVRCRTNIFATQVSIRDGKYFQTTGWVFNNLTYLPSARANWKTNPLAANGKVGGTVQWKAADGRQWRTECDTPATGRGACRSYAMASVIKTKLVNGAWTWRIERQWVFNNIVLFAEGNTRPVTSIPPYVLDQERLTPSGIGPFQIGTSMFVLEKLGYGTYEMSDAGCRVWTNGSELNKRGVHLDRAAEELHAVHVDRAGIRTDGGATVGMTVAQVRKLYGPAFKVEQKQNFGSREWFGSVRQGDYELLFTVANGGGYYGASRQLRDSDVVNSIVAQRYTTDVSFDGC